MKKLIDKLNLSDGIKLGSYVIFTLGLLTISFEYDSLLMGIPAGILALAIFCKFFEDYGDEINKVNLSEEKQDERQQ